MDTSLRPEHIRPVVERLSRTMRRIFEHRRIDIALNGTEGLCFQGEQQDPGCGTMLATWGRCSTGRIFSN